MIAYKKVLGLIVLAVGLLCYAACQQEQKTDLKIMSYNIRHGEGIDTILDLSRSAKIIRAQAPDFCGLQEIDDYCIRTDSVGQTGYLAEKTSMKGTFGKFMDFQGGAYGMATLSAKPVILTEILSLPDGKYEPRVAIVQKVQIADGCAIVIANVHFEWISGQEGSNNRLKQAEALMKYINELNQPTIITGDFNCTPDSPTMQYFGKQGFTFVKKGSDKLSFQGERKVEIDHLIFRNTEKVKFKKKSIQLLNEPIVSDHRPLIVELEVIF